MTDDCKPPLCALPDTRGRQSRTLFFVAISWAAVVVKFLIAGMTLPMIGTMPEMGAGEFGAAVGAILAIWLGREWIDKSKTGGAD